MYIYITIYIYTYKCLYIFYRYVDTHSYKLYPAKLEAQAYRTDTD